MKRTNIQVVDYDHNNEKTWCVEDQPTSKLVQHGPKALTNTDLLAVLLTGLTGATEKARDIYNWVDQKVSALSSLTTAELIKLGLTKNKAAIVKAALELGMRAANGQEIKQPIKSSETVKQIMQPLIGDLAHEEFWFLTLNRANKVIRKHKISQGGLSGTVIDKRLIMKKALEDLACSIIYVHNHPSGNPSPSDADLKLTVSLKEAGDFLDIKTLDHVIVSQEGYHSMADEGQIE